MSATPAIIPDGGRALPQAADSAATLDVASPQLLLETTLLGSPSFERFVPAVAVAAASDAAPAAAAAASSAVVAAAAAVVVVAAAASAAAVVAVVADAGVVASVAAAALVGVVLLASRRTGRTPHSKLQTAYTRGHEIVRCLAKQKYPY